ncbi:DUF2071 domain-containing protein [Lewinella sp. W8]|uniref:DUF2071 domain-containing protein n=1 Tax=Lewinella sp. W8 TaxID=2528208 RepID=UPI001067BAAF|nr:DUF2071 domain-containing protein [Lewinella sp. W8]MTB50226.1 hypothetical protein [Lewinella sp. W8]
MIRLPSHPFGVDAFFRRSVVLTFALPQVQLLPRLPAPLELDGFADQYGFVAFALVDTTALRPSGFPDWMGQDFFLAGYRIFVRFRDERGRRLRGLYILESQTDSWRMTLLGNAMTHYNYRRITVGGEDQEDRQTIFSPSEGFSVTYSSADDEAGLPPGSPFSSWKEARRFAGPMPFTFTYLAQQDRVMIVEGVRRDWTPVPVNIHDWKLPWLDRQGWGDAVLASAFEVTNVPYHWKKGRTESWRPNEYPGRG